MDTNNKEKILKILYLLEDNGIVCDYYDNNETISYKFNDMADFYKAVEVLEDNIDLNALHYYPATLDISIDVNAIPAESDAKVTEDLFAQIKPKYIFKLGDTITTPSDFKEEGFVTNTLYEITLADDTDDELYRVSYKNLDHPNVTGGTGDLDDIFTPTNNLEQLSRDIFEYDNNITSNMINRPWPNEIGTQNGHNPDLEELIDFGNRENICDPLVEGLDRDTIKVIDAKSADRTPYFYHVAPTGGLSMFDDLNEDFIDYGRSVEQYEKEYLENNAANEAIDESEDDDLITEMLIDSDLVEDDEDEEDLDESASGFEKAKFSETLKEIEKDLKEKGFSRTHSKQLADHFDRLKAYVVSDLKSYYQIDCLDEEDLFALYGDDYLEEELKLTKEFFDEMIGGRQKEERILEYAKTDTGMQDIEDELKTIYPKYSKYKLEDLPQFVLTQVYDNIRNGFVDELVKYGDGNEVPTVAFDIFDLAYEPVYQRIHARRQLNNSLDETYSKDELDKFKNKVFNQQKVMSIYRKKKYGEKRLMCRTKCVNCGREKKLFLSNLVTDPKKYGSCVCSDTNIDARMNTITDLYRGKKLLKSNTSGYTGVSWVAKYRGEPYNKWRAYIDIDGKRNYLGDFNSKSKAIRARKAAAKKGLKGYNDNKNQFMATSRRKHKRTRNKNYKKTK